MISQLQNQNTSQPTNWTPWIIGGVGLLLVLVIGIIGYLVGSSKNKK